MSLLFRKDLIQYTLHSLNVWGIFEKKTIKVFDASGQNMTLRLEDEFFLALLLLF